MLLSTAVGFFSALGWAISSYLWVLSTLVKMEESKSSVVIEGRSAFNQNDLKRYLDKTGKINANAGAVSAASAALSAIALFLQTIGY